MDLSNRRNADLSLTQQPLVSVIIVVYNGSLTLDATIQSVIRQTYAHLDFVLVDGGSTDETLAIADRYREHFGSFVSEPDKGIYDAMNKGIRRAKGQWLYFLGSDDELADEAVLNTFFSDPSNLAYDLLYGDVTSPSYKGPYDGPFTYHKLLSKNISHQAIFYKKSIFERIGGYNPRYRLHADWDLNLRCFTDATVKTKYFSRTVARFGPEGVSAGHDLLFLREKLIPAKLRQLREDREHGIRNIKFYDEWWRFLRNAEIREINELMKYTGTERLPGSIRRMIGWQRLLPASFLHSGVVSKTWMVLSFICYRILGD